MATRKEILEIGGREVTISNPDKVYFPQAGHTKLDLVRYFLAVADGALVGVRGRPMALKRFVDGAEKEPFFQKRAPDNRPDWMRAGDADLPLRAAPRTRWSSTRRRASPGSPTSAAWTSTRTPSAPRTWTTPTSCAWTSTRCPACPGRRSARSRSSAARRWRRWASSAGRRRRARAGIHINVRIEPRWTYPQVRRAALALARDVERRAPGDRHLASGGRRSATASSSTTTRTRRTGPWRPPTPCGPRRTRGSRSRCAGTRWRTAA